MKTIVLIGFKSCGKSTLAEALARLTRRALVDTDALLEQQHEAATGLKIPFRQLFSEIGEQEFRAREHQALLHLEQSRGTVIATGGGIVLHQPNLPLLRRCGVVVFVDTAPDILHKRLAGVDSPLFRSADWATVHSQRLPLYRAVADHTFSITREEPPAALADRLLRQIKEQHHGA